jgi:ribosomal-protein-alanine N-acetyltransferase
MMPTDTSKPIAALVPDVPQSYRGRRRGDPMHLPTVFYVTGRHDPYSVGTLPELAKIAAMTRRIAPCSAIRLGSRVYLRSPRRADAGAFIAAAHASRKLHGRWVQPPSTAPAFNLFVARFGKRIDAVEKLQHVSLLLFRADDHALVGAFNFGDITRGALQSACLGYFAFAPHAGAGYMTEGIELVLDFAFRTLKLHRVEVNVQPTNTRSLALAERAGFKHEGYSPRYLRIAGRWRDHIRCALRVDDWRLARRARNG